MGTEIGNQVVLSCAEAGSAKAKWILLGVVGLRAAFLHSCDTEEQ